MSWKPSRVAHSVRPLFTGIIAELTDQEKPRRRPSRAGTRSAARLAAVQAIYQIEVTGGEPATIIREFKHYRLNNDPRLDQMGENDSLIPADAALFTELVEGTHLRLSELDTLLGGALTPDWPLDRLETVLRAALRVGAFELLGRIDVPARVVITEYVDIAHAFFSGKEPGLLNGVLDRLAHQLRPLEMERQA